MPFVPPGGRSGSTKTSFKRKAVTVYRPLIVKKWDAFDPALLITDKNKGVVFKPNMSAEDMFAARKPFDDEISSFSAYWTPARRNIMEFMCHAEPTVPFDKIHQFPTSKIYKLRLSTDEACQLHDGTITYIGEQKALKVALEGNHPAEEYEKYLTTLDETNLANSIFQLFTYLFVSKDSVYGFVSNYEQWFFVKRIVKDDEEVLLMSRYYKRDDPGDVNARLAYGYFLKETLRNTTQLKRGKFGFGEEPGGAKKPEEEEEEEEDTNKKNGRNWVDHLSKRMETLRVSATQENATESKRTKRAFQEYKVSADELDLPIPLCMMDGSECLSYSDKASVHRGMVNGQDLVWKLVDFYGTPRHSEWTDEDLNGMMVFLATCSIFLTYILCDRITKCVFMRA